MAILNPKKCLTTMDISEKLLDRTSRLTRTLACDFLKKLRQQPQLRKTKKRLLFSRSMQLIEAVFKGSQYPNLLVGLSCIGTSEQLHLNVLHNQNSVKQIDKSCTSISLEISYDMF